MSAAAVGRPPRRGRIVWGLAIVLALLLALLAGAVIYAGIGQLGHAPVTIVIDGEEVLHGLALGELSPLHRLALAVGVSVVVLVALVVLPAALLLGMMLLLMAVLTAVGVPILVVVLVLALVFSPVLLLVLLLWWLLRRPRKHSPPAPGTATMPR